MTMPYIPNPWRREVSFGYNDGIDLYVEMYRLWKLKTGEPIREILFPELSASSEAVASFFFENEKQSKSIVFEKERDGKIKECLLEYANGMLKISDRDRVFSSAIAVGSFEFCEQIKELIQPFTEVVENRNVRILGSDEGTIYLKMLPPLGERLIRDNYSPKETESFDHILNDLVSPNPCGRFIVLQGEPGTGKTYFVRGIVSACANNKKILFILVPASMTSKLAEPGLLDVFVNDEKTYDRRVFILEDSDHALVPREGDNLSEISALLNLTDGLIGKALNLSIICTTNAASIKIDRALKRAGRLCREIAFQPLSFEHASKVANRLGVRMPALGSKYTLAELYAGEKCL